MDDRLEFAKQVEKEIDVMRNNKEIRDASIKYMNEINEFGYTYHFKWAGLPIIQYPQDIIAMQEIIFNIKPDLIIETGIARGGSVVFYSSMLELLGNGGKVIGIDIDIREHNRKAIEEHKLSKNIKLIQNSSIDPSVINEIENYIAENGCKNVVVVLDSDHTHEHVFKELELYSKFVTKNSFLVVFDTGIENAPEDRFLNRSWGKGNNPMTAVFEFIKQNNDFVIDENIESKLLITVAPKGYLKRIK